MVFDTPRAVGGGAAMTSVEWRENSIQNGVGRSAFYQAKTHLMKNGLVEERSGRFFAVKLSDTVSEISGANAEVVQESTHPLGGGLVDSEASGEKEEVNSEVEDAWGDSTGEGGDVSG